MQFSRRWEFFIFIRFWWCFYLIPINETSQLDVNIFSLYLTVFKLEGVKEFWIIRKCFVFHPILMGFSSNDSLKKLLKWHQFWGLIVYAVILLCQTFNCVQSFSVHHYTMSSTLLCQIKYCVHTYPVYQRFMCSPFTSQFYLGNSRKAWNCTDQIGYSLCCVLTI